MDCISCTAVSLAHRPPGFGHAANQTTANPRGAARGVIGLIRTPTPLRFPLLPRDHLEPDGEAASLFRLLHGQDVVEHVSPPEHTYSLHQRKEMNHSPSLCASHAQHTEPQETDAVLRARLCLCAATGGKGIEFAHQAGRGPAASHLGVGSGQSVCVCVCMLRVVGLVTEGGSKIVTAVRASCGRTSLFHTQTWTGDWCVGRGVCVRVCVCVCVCVYEEERVSEAARHGHPRCRFLLKGRYLHVGINGLSRYGGAEYSFQNDTAS